MAQITKNDEEFRVKIQGKGDNLSAWVISAGMMKTTFPSLYRHPAVRKLRKRLGSEVSKAVGIS